MVGHGHFQVNGRKVSIPSFIVKVGEVVQLRADLQDAGAGRRQPDRGPRAGAAVARAGRQREEGHGARACRSREDIQIPVQEQLIVELFSK